MVLEDNRLSILERIEQGETPVENAIAELQELNQQSEGVSNRMEQNRDTEEKHASMDRYAPTRRERQFKLANSIRNWQPQMMAKPLRDKECSWEWPWPEIEWQWMWQDFVHPLHIDHTIDMAEANELEIASHQADIFVGSWDKPSLDIKGAAFDLRIGRDENAIRVASSSGQVYVYIPTHVRLLRTDVKQADIWIDDVSADMDIRCLSGDVSCERITGNVKARINGGDVRLIGIEGSIDMNVIRGNTEVHDISSEDVVLNATEGKTWVSLDTISSGRFRCENDEGDINILTKGPMSCELLIEATKGGSIAPVRFLWQQLLERSETMLHGILNDGGASVSLITQTGRIYVRESWIGAFSRIYG